MNGMARLVYLGLACLGCVGRIALGAADEGGAPVQSAEQAPAQPPIEASVQLPVEASGQSPVEAPAQSPDEALPQSTEQAPAQSPDEAPAQSSETAATPSPDEAPAQSTEEPIFEWLTSYKLATTTAEAEQKQLIVYFQGSEPNRLRDQFETDTLSDPEMQQVIRERFVAVKVPLDYQITVSGKRVNLLEHAAFAEMDRNEGLAIIDYASVGEEYYGHVVSTIPFVKSKYYRFQPKHVPVALNLPQGTLTQRSLVLAVRIHPEAPASTDGNIDPVLVSEANSHSHHQARIRLQGHHAWGSRFQRITRRLGFGLRAQEVCAESWPHESLMDAAVDCVDSWRHSSGHWSAVRAHQVKFGYDMKRGSNGIWYATGIFGNHR